jgi:hypothetical protein
MSLDVTRVRGAARGFDRSRRGRISSPSRQSFQQPRLAGQLRRAAIEQQLCCMS